MSLDNTEVNEILEKLERMKNESLAVDLLREFNEATKEHGTILLNKNPNLDHEKWKNRCDKAQERVSKIIKKIRDINE